MITHPTPRRHNLVFPFIILPSFAALAIHLILQSQWLVAGAFAVLWLFILLFSISFAVQALVALALSIGFAVQRQWLPSLIAALAAGYLGFTVFITSRMTEQQLFANAGVGPRPWLLRPWNLFSGVPDSKVAARAFLAGLGFLVLLLAALSLL